MNFTSIDESNYCLMHIIKQRTLLIQYLIRLKTDSKPSFDLSQSQSCYRTSLITLVRNVISVLFPVTHHFCECKSGYYKTRFSYFRILQEQWKEEFHQITWTYSWHWLLFLKMVNIVKWDECKFIVNCGDNNVEKENGASPIGCDRLLNFSKTINTITTQ